MMSPGEGYQRVRYAERKYRELALRSRVIVRVLREERVKPNSAAARARSAEIKRQRELARQYSAQATACAKQARAIVSKAIAARRAAHGARP